MTLQPRDPADSALSNQAVPPKPKRAKPYWIPTLLEALTGLGLAAAWVLGVLIVIRHEDVGFFLTIVYLLMGLAGAAVTWLIMWPLIRVLNRD